MNELISVIVPIYNAENYLDKCIKSIIAQTYRNLEIILVDDGSTDNSLSICNQYSKKDNRIVVLHKKNGGVSSARNMGLINSTGKYIGFVDPDDYIEPSMYQKLLKSLIQENTKMSMCGYTKFRYGKPIKKNIYTDKIISNEKLLSDVFKGIFMGVMWNKLFLKKLFINHNNLILFNENIHICEDSLMLTIILKYCENIAICNESLYNYVLADGSICRSNMNEKKITIINAMDLIVQECNCNFINLVNLSKIFSINNKINILFKIQESSLKNKKEYIYNLKQDIKLLPKNSNMKIKLKQIVALYLPYIYIILKKVKRRFLI